MKPVSVLFCFLALLSPVPGKDTITDAFEDLKHDGLMKEEDSPMRIPATEEMLKGLKDSLPGSGYFCFPELRQNGLRSADFVPARWAQKNGEERQNFALSAQPGEFVVYQIGLYPVKDKLDNVKLTFSPLVNETGNRISPEKMTCFNLGGTGVNGKTFTRRLDVPQNKLQSLWLGVDLPQKAKGTYSGTVTITPENAPPEIIKISLSLKGDPVANHGDNEGWRRSRLHWLNSAIGTGTAPTAPYTPVRVKGKTLKYLGGEVTLSDSGLPKEITTFYNDFNSLTPAGNNSVLKGGMTFSIETDQGTEKLTPVGFKVNRDSQGKASWTALSKGENFSVTCSGTFEFDGSSDITLTVDAQKDIAVRDIKLVIPYTEQTSRYFMGLGKKGGSLPKDPIHWKWNENNHQDAFWMGDVNAGLKFKFKDEGYKRPLVNVYYKYGKLVLPRSWGNGGKGGIDIATTGNGAAEVIARSGERQMKKGDRLDFGLEMLITPVKPLDWNHQVGERYYHSNSDLSSSYIPEAKKNGANIINVHHKKDIYPFINYPYYDESAPDLKKFIEAAHEETLKVKAYYTTREISIKLPELWALRSLGDEIIMDGPGRECRTVTNPNGPDEWLNANLGDHFIPAWHNAFNEGKYKGEKDVSVLTTPDSRWNNYYLAGLDWMISHMGLDGIYIDDSALDRESLKRARRILDADGKRRMVDLHSWNHMNDHAGNISSMLLYSDLSPYLDRLWIGEAFSPDSSPDFWMVEMSGIPFGLMSETLNSHNYWRGMVYGMTPRLPWSGDPTPLWKLYDSFGMKDARMYGYWNKGIPVATSSPDVHATVYLKKDKALIVLANWTDKPVSATLAVDEKKLGFKPAKAVMPAMDKIQSAADVDLSQPLELKGNQGAFILLEK